MTKQIIKKISLLLAFSFIFFSISNSQTDKNYELTGILVDDIKILLPVGKITVDIIDGINVLPRYQELQTKFMIGVQQNREWFLEQQKIVEQTGEPLKYHANLGMTEEEFNEFKNLMESGTGVEMVKSESEEVSISLQKNIIILSGTGRLNILDSLKIDLDNKIVWFGEFQLDKLETISINSDKNALKSKWKGYSWRYDYSNKPKGFSEFETMNDINTLKMKIYKLTIGRLESDGKTYIQITNKEIENGVKTKNIQIPFKF